MAVMSQRRLVLMRPLLLVAAADRHVFAKTLVSQAASRRDDNAARAAHDYSAPMATRCHGFESGQDKHVADEGSRNHRCSITS